MEFNKGFVLGLKDYHPHIAHRFFGRPCHFDDDLDELKNRVERNWDTDILMSVDKTSSTPFFTYDEVCGEDVGYTYCYVVFTEDELTLDTSKVLTNLPDDRKEAEKWIDGLGWIENSYDALKTAMQTKLPIQLKAVDSMDFEKPYTKAHNGNYRYFYPIIEAPKVTYYPFDFEQVVKLMKGNRILKYKYRQVKEDTRIIGVTLGVDGSFIITLDSTCFKRTPDELLRDYVFASSGKPCGNKVEDYVKI